MVFTFETRGFTVGDLLSGSHIFRIPQFQRRFAWSEDNAAQLFDDIQTAFAREESNYFLGPIIVAKEGASKPFDIIDGQQRLICISIYLAVLRDVVSSAQFADGLQQHLWRDENPASRWASAPRIKVRKQDRNLYELIVGALQGTSPKQINVFNCTLRDVAVRIRSEVKNVSTDYWKRFAQYILNNCHVILINTSNIDDGYRLFRSINTLGQPLTDLDIARSHVIANNENGEALAEIWDQIAENLSEDELKSYLYSAVSFVDPDLEGLDLHQAMRDILRQPLAEHKLRKTLTSFLEYHKKIDEGDLGFSMGGPTINRILKYLKVLPFDHWRAGTLLWLSRSPDAAQTLRFLRALDALCTGLVVLGSVNNTLANRFQKIRARIEADNVLSDPSSEIYLTNTEKEKIREKLSGPIPPKARFLRYIMLRLNAEMLDKAFEGEVKLDIEIEHVLPQKPSPKSVWMENFPDSHRRLLLCQLLGNLAILSKPINIKAKNYDFHKKRDTIFGTSGSNTFPVTADLVHYQTWTEREILLRHERLLRIAERVMNPVVLPQ